MLAGQTLDRCLFGVNRFKELNTVDGACSWFSILMEEIYEAFAEISIEKQREEMEQIAAVVVQIIECLDRKLEARENEKGN
jgi:NTP pyrophosphatase (non-canonical NTP hydrolase)